MSALAVLQADAALWAKLLVLYLPTYEKTVNSAYVVNAAAPGALYNGLKVGTIDHILGSYIQGDGSTGIINTQLNPNTLGLQNTFGFEIWSLTAAQGGAVDMGNGNALAQCRTASDNFAARLNAAGASSFANAQGAGPFSVSRVGPLTTDQVFYMSGQPVANTGSSFTTTPDNNPIYCMGRSGTASFSSRQFVMFAIHTGFTAAQELTFYNAMAPLFEVTLDYLGDDRIYQQVGGSATISLAGTKTLGTDDIEFHVINATTGAEVKAWTTVASGATGTRWSGTLSVATTTGFCNLEFRKVGSSRTFTYPKNFAVGELVLMFGQSNVRNMWSLRSALPTAHALTRRWTGDGIGHWWAPDLTIQTTEPAANQGGNGYGGDGSVEFANLLRTQFNCPVGVLELAVGGTLVASWKNGQTTYNILLNALTLEAGSPGWTFGRAIWLQGETDATTPTDPTTYGADLALVFSNIRTQTSNATLPIWVAILATMTGGTDAGIDAIRQKIIAYRDTAGNAGDKEGPSAVDLTRTDQYHFPASESVRLAKRFAALIAGAVISPKWLSATSGIGTNIIVVTPTGGVTIQDALGNTSATGLTGFDVEVDTVARSITAAAIVSNTLRITFTGTPTVSAAKVRYQYGGLPDITNPVYSAQLPSGDTKGMPMEPTRGQMTVTVS